MSSHDPPIILAKIDGSVDSNRELASNYKIQGFPTIKILRDGGKNIQDYRGPRDADGIVAYLKRQVGPASVEIKSAEDASNLIEGKKISIVSACLSFFPFLGFLVLHLVDYMLLRCFALGWSIS